MVRSIISIALRLCPMTFAMKWVPLPEINAVQNAMVMDKEFIYEFVDICAARWITGMTSNSISRVCVYSKWDGLLTLLLWIRFSVLNLSPGGWLVPWELVPYQDFSVVLCFLQIRHSVGTVARLVLLRAHMSMMLSPYAVPFMPPWPLHFGTHSESTGISGKRSWPTSIEHVILSTWLSWAPSILAALWEAACLFCSDHWYISAAFNGWCAHLVFDG